MMKTNAPVVISDNNKMTRNYFIKLILSGWLLNIYRMYTRDAEVHINYPVQVIRIVSLQAVQNDSNSWYFQRHYVQVISGFVNEDNLGKNMINCLSIVHCARIPFTMTSKPNLQSVAGFFPPRIIR